MIVLAGLPLRTHTLEDLTVLDPKHTAVANLELGKCSQGCIHAASMLLLTARSVLSKLTSDGFSRKASVRRLCNRPEEAIWCQRLQFFTKNTFLFCPSRLCAQTPMSLVILPGQDCPPQRSLGSDLKASEFSRAHSSVHGTVPWRYAVIADRTSRRRSSLDEIFENEDQWGPILL